VTVIAATTAKTTAVIVVGIVCYFLPASDTQLLGALSLGVAHTGNCVVATVRHWPAAPDWGEVSRAAESIVGRPRFSR
jgi:hypothetical protein